MGNLAKTFRDARSALQSVCPLSAQPVFARLRKPVPRSLSRIRRQRRRVVADDTLPGDTGAESPREQPSRISALRRQASRLPNAERHVLSKQIARDLCRKQQNRAQGGRGVSPRVLLSSISWTSKKWTRGARRNAQKRRTVKRAKPYRAKEKNTREPPPGYFSLLDHI